MTTWRWRASPARRSPPSATPAELGPLAVQQLVSRIRNKELEVESMTVQPELIVRRSVKSPADGATGAMNKKPRQRGGFCFGPLVSGASGLEAEPPGEAVQVAAVQIQRPAVAAQLPSWAVRVCSMSWRWNRSVAARGPGRQWPERRAG